MFGINLRESPEVVQDFVDAFGVTFPVLLDEAGEVYAGYSRGAQLPFPLDYIIDQEGIIRYIATEYDPDEIVGEIEVLLGLTEPPPLEITCVLIDHIVPGQGYLSFEVTFTNNTETQIQEGEYELRIEHFERTSCNLLTEPLFVHTVTPGGSLPPGATTVRFDLGPLPAGLEDFNPIATKIASVLYAPEPGDTDDCCFSWRASPYPLRRQAQPLP